MFFGLILFYVDEAGYPSLHHEPLLDGETPLFCLSAVAVDSARWRDLDRALLGLKRYYFPQEMAAFAANQGGRRPEQYEIKGKDLFKPSSAHNHRSRTFARRVLELLDAQGVKLFAVVWKKDAQNQVDPMAMYTHGLQILAERFHYYCLAQGRRGIIVVDSRTKNLDFQVASGHLSFLFGHPDGRRYTTLVEAPMFADSTLSVGVQLADFAGSCVYGYYYQRRCGQIAGLFNGNQPVTPAQAAQPPPGGWAVRTPARDYGHCMQYRSILDTLQFRRTDVPPPTAGVVVPGYYGFRELG